MHVPRYIISSPHSPEGNTEREHKGDLKRKFSGMNVMYRGSKKSYDNVNLHFYLSHHLDLLTNLTGSFKR